MRTIIVHARSISYYLVIVVVFVYAIVVAEYLTDLNKRVLEIQAKELVNNSFYVYFMSLSFVIMLLSPIVIWLISSFLFHLTAILFDGKLSFKYFLKCSGLCCIVPALGFAIAYVLSDGIQLPEKNIPEFFKTDPLFYTISWIINISSILYYILLIPVVRYLYRINWFKSTGVIVIPILSIYLIGQFFANFYI
jgi:hypothetical protein